MVGTESTMSNRHTFTTSRTLPAPPAEVYAAFASPELLASWWGPAGFTNNFEVFEFRAGGRWTFVMHGPDGAHYPNECVFEALMPGAQVVIRHACAPFFTLAVTLAPSAGGTLLTWDQTFDDAATAQTVQHIVVPANEQNLDRLTLALRKAAGASV